MYKIIFFSLTSCICVFGYLDIFPTMTSKKSNISDAYQKLVESVFTDEELSTRKDYIKLMVDNYKEIAITSRPNSRKRDFYSNINNLVKLPEVTTESEEILKPHVEARSLDNIKRVLSCVRREHKLSKNNKDDDINTNRNAIISAFPVKFLTITTRRLCPICNKRFEIDSIVSENSRNFPIKQESFDRKQIAEHTKDNQEDNVEEYEYEGMPEHITTVTSYDFFTLIEKYQYSTNISDPIDDWDTFADSDHIKFKNDTFQRVGTIADDDDDNKESIITTKSPLSNPNSCVFCNNIDNVFCENPLNKLIPSLICKFEGEICYSMHTPFGIVVRGCINPYGSLSTYVCVQHLCNTITISELPFVFSTKEEWISNVKEITKYLNTARDKTLICWNCEANITAEVTQDNMKCLSGAIDNLQPQLCREDEVCGIKVIRNKNYIWRGCVKFPLYNYWWQFCNNDVHCNFEKMVTLYD